MKKLFIILISIILLCLFFYKPIDYSYFLNNYNDDIIGNININNNNYLLLQGLDNEYYLNHDSNKDIDNNGSVFLGYKTDLNRNQINELFIPFNYEININDVLNINYLSNNINYKIVNNTSNNDKLIIYVYENNNIIKKLDAIRI